MATTGELRAIIEELELIDIGDAASYLGEELPVEPLLVSVESIAATCANAIDHFMLTDCTPS